MWKWEVGELSFVYTWTIKDNLHANVKIIDSLITEKTRSYAPVKEQVA